MRKILFGMTAAAAVAAVLVFSTSAAAGDVKPCWDHLEGNGELTRVWANGGGHEAHVGDFLLGDSVTRADCEDGIVVP